MRIDWGAWFYVENIVKFDKKSQKSLKTKEKLRIYAIFQEKKETASNFYRDWANYW